MKALCVGITLLAILCAPASAKTYTLEEVTANAEQLDGKVVRMIFLVHPKRLGRYPGKIFYQQPVYGVSRNGTEQSISATMHVHKDHIAYVRSRGTREGPVSWYVEIRVAGWGGVTYAKSGLPVSLMLRGTAKSGDSYKFGSTPAVHGEVENIKESKSRERQAAPAAAAFVDLSLSPKEKEKLKLYIAQQGFGSVSEWIKAMDAKAEK